MSQPGTVQSRPPAPWNLPANPLFRRYCRSRLRPRAFGTSLIIVLIIATFMTVFLPMFVKQIDEQRGSRIRQSLAEYDAALKSPRTHYKNMSIAERIRSEADLLRQRNRLAEIAARPPRTEGSYYYGALLALLALQSGMLFLTGTGQVAGGMTAEADEGSVDSVRLTPLTPLTKTLGYLFGLPVREYALAACTLPFSAWCLWKAQLGPELWLPVYGVVFLTGILYHLTGLVSGTVLKSKRWAFLLSMGLVFLLYSVVPWGARLGFPFVRFLTVWPVLAHSVAVVGPQLAAGISLASGADATKTGVPFFGMKFSEIAFTLIVQGTFAVTMLVMVWRKWKRPESHLLSKAWGLGLFLWVNALVVGSALPLADSGDLFPSRTLRQNSELRRELNQEIQRSRSRAAEPAEALFRAVNSMKPNWTEAVMISGIYAILLLAVMMLKIIMITPGNDGQQRGLRRALRLGKTRAPPGADEASAFPSTLILVLMAVAGWLVFHRGLAATEWFAGGDTGDGIAATAAMAAVFGLTCLTFQAMLEGGRQRGPFLAVVFLGIVPLLASAVASVSGAGQEVAWAVASVSPVPHLVYATSLLNPGHHFLPEVTARACFWIWCFCSAAFLFTRMRALRRSWSRRRSLMQAREA